MDTHLAPTPTSVPPPKRWSVLWRGGLSGLIAAAVAVGVGELLAAVVGASSAPVVAVGSAAIDLTPTPLKEFAVREFGTYDKLILLSGIYTTLGLLALMAGLLAVRRLVLGLALVGLFGVVAAVAAVSRPGGDAFTALPSLLGAAAGAVVLARLVRAVRGAGAGSGEETGGTGRRAFLTLTGAAAATAAVSGVVGRIVQNRRFDAAESRGDITLPAPAEPAPALPAGSSVDVAGITPLITPSKAFYRVDTSLVLPQVPADTWKLRIHGMVDKPFEIDFDQLLKRDLVERTITLSCVSNEVGGQYVGTARWLGFPLADLLREAGVRSGANQLVSTSSDGAMTIGSPTEVVMDGRDALICVGMNGEPLLVEHGFPARLLVPGLYGYASATKWVTDLELTTFDDYDVYWVKRKWAALGEVKTASRIDVPKPFAKVKPGAVTVAGVAYAQHRGISQVQLRVDGGAWQDTKLTTQVSADVWRQWTWDWDATAGSHMIEVRAMDGRGDVQTEKRVTPFPAGASGWHNTVVQVAA